MSVLQGMAAGQYSFQVQAMDAAGVLGDPTPPQTFTQDPSLQGVTQAASTGSVAQVCPGCFICVG